MILKLLKHIYNMKTEIEKLLLERKEITKADESNWSNEQFEATGNGYINEMLKVDVEARYDKNRDEILDLIKKDFDNLEIDFILETLTHLGWCPCLTYDDDGHWAVNDGGYSTVRLNDTDDYRFGGSIPAKDFKETIREAVRYYVFEEETE